MKTIKSVEKTFELLDCIAENNGNINLTELSTQLDMSITTAFGFLATLEKLDVVKKDPVQKKYSLSKKLDVYSSVYRKQFNLIAESQVFLESIRNLLNETVHLAVPYGKNKIQYVAKEESRYPIRMTSLVDSIEYSNNSAIGKAIFNEEKAVDVEVISLGTNKLYLKKEVEMGAYCLAMKISLPNDITAGISIVIPNARYSDETLTHCLNIMTSEISKMTTSLTNTMMIKTKF